MLTNSSKLCSAEKKCFIVISGNIGSGKTTLTNKLSRYLGWRNYLEPVENNPYLDDFYKDMLRWSFPLQIFFLSHRYNTHQEIQSFPYHSIQDRSIYEDAHIFARALFEQQLMEARDYENYLNLYHCMIRNLEAPTLLIYLRRSVPKLMERIRMRDREFERSIPIDYITRLNQYYDDWYDQYNLGPALSIDTDSMDFHNEECFANLLERVKGKLESNNVSTHQLFQ